MNESKDKSGFEVEEEFRQALIDLEALPDVLQMVIRSYKLDSIDYTQADCINLGNAHKEIYSVLSLVQRQLWDISDKVKAISCHQEG